MADVNDFLGFGKLGTALLDYLGKTVKYIHYPSQIKRIARAQADAYNIIKKSVDDDVIISINGTNIEIKSNDEIVKNRISNMISFEMKKQENVDEIIGKALEKLEQMNQETSGNLQEDWINNFIECSQCVSDKEMQDVWASILASEFTSTGKYSIRTLNLLKCMSKKEAVVFTKIVNNSFKWGGMNVLVDYDRNFDIYSISILEVMQMSDLGLLNDTGKSLNFMPSSKQCFFVDDLCVVVENLSGVKKSIPIVVFSSVGNELSNLVNEHKIFKNEDLRKLFKFDNNLKVTVHKKFNDSQYYTAPLFEL